MLLEDMLESRQFRRLLPLDILNQIKALRYKTRRFVFDKDASAKHGEFSISGADLVCENAQFAIPPFPNTYIEVDNAASLRAGKELRIYDDAAKKIGYLFTEHGDIFVIADMDKGEAVCTPFRYHHVGRDTGLRPSLDIRIVKEADFDPRIVSIMKELGGTPVEVSEPESYHAFKNMLMLGKIDPSVYQRAKNYRTNIVDVWDVSLVNELPQDIFNSMVTECSGGLKRALAALLLLNQRNGVTLSDRKPERRIIKGKVRTYMAHSVVSIDLGKKTVRNAFNVEDRSSPRRHEVRGHFVHYHVKDGCAHEWSILEDEELRQRDVENGRTIARWRCSHCEGRRVFRESFHRGDATKGYVTKEYAVTDSNT